MTALELIHQWLEDNGFHFHPIVSDTDSNYLEDSRHIVIEVGKKRFFKSMGYVRREKACYIDIYCDGVDGITVYGVGTLVIWLKIEDPDFFVKLQGFIDDSIEAIASYVV